MRFYLSLLLLVGIFFFSCKKPVLRDTALIPNDNLGLKFTDTLSIKAYTDREDSVLVSNTLTAVAGTMDDPVFGKTVAGFYTQLELAEPNPGFVGANAVLDSAVLTLKYSGYYGSFKVPQTFVVFELSESLDNEAAYYSNQRFATIPGVVGQENFFPDFTDEVLVGNDSLLPPHLRIRLDRAFGEKILHADSVDLADDDNFKAFLKGLYITGVKTSPGRGLIYFDTYEDSRFGVTLYYNDSLTFHMPFEGTSIVNTYRHDYRGSVVEPFIDNESTLGNKVYIQPLAGLNGKFSVPNIKNLGDILINKAELVITKIPDSTGTDSIFTSPEELTLRASTGEGGYEFVPDDGTVPPFGGDRLTEVKDSTGEKLVRYRFLLTRYYQEIIEGKREDFGIFILPTGREFLANRVIIGGVNHPKYALKLNITYTLIE